MTRQKKKVGAWSPDLYPYRTRQADRAGSLHRTQAEAESRARQNLKNQGGGELTMMGRDGRIRSKDTIALENDPNPPRDREH